MFKDNTWRGTNLSKPLWGAVGLVGLVWCCYRPECLCSPKIHMLGEHKHSGRYFPSCRSPLRHPNPAPEPWIEPQDVNRRMKPVFPLPQAPAPRWPCLGRVAGCSAVAGEGLPAPPARLRGALGAAPNRPNIIHSPASALARALGANHRVWLPRPRLNPAGRRPESSARPLSQRRPSPHGLLLLGPRADL